MTFVKQNSHVVIMKICLLFQKKVFFQKFKKNNDKIQGVAKRPHTYFQENLPYKGKILDR